MYEKCNRVYTVLNDSVDKLSCNYCARELDLIGNKGKEFW